MIGIGSLKRNFSLLQSVLNKLPEVGFHILMGRNNRKPYFEKVENVRLYLFISEVEKLQLMQRCDGGMSVMEDTIGSTVITTSMAAGLVQVVSDIRSIRNYCDEMNSFLCMTEQDFLKAITRLGEYRVPSAEDLDFILRALDQGFKLYNLPDYLYPQRQRHGNTATTSGLTQMKSIAYVRRLHKERVANQSTKNSYSDENLKRALEAGSFERKRFGWSSQFHLKYVLYKNNKSGFHYFTGCWRS